MLKEQNEKQEEMMKILNKFKIVGGDDIDIDNSGWQAPYFQGTDTELMMIEEYI
ncbi:MAG: hypothetical protein ACR5KV_05875 [Wolbachia sp.]